MNRLLKYEAKFISIHNNIILSILVYAAITLSIDNTKNIINTLIIASVITHIINIILFKYKFYEKVEIYYTLKYIQMIIAAFASFEEKNFIATCGIITYILLVIEVLAGSGKHKNWFKYLSTILMILPIFIANVTAFIVGKFTSEFILDSVFLFFYIIFVIIGIIYIVFDNLIELYEKIETQIKMRIITQKANEELQLTQRKYKKAHDQLVKQKFDLEVANKKLTRASSEMYIQNELLKYISGTLEIDELMEMVTDAIIGAIGLDTCTIIIYDVNKDKYHLKIKSTYKKNYTQLMKQTLASGNLDYYFNTNKVYIDNEVNKDKYTFLSDRDVGSIIVMPLIRNNLTYGLIIAEQKSENTFVDNLQFFDGIATQINIAINNANLYAKMEDMAIRDGLTGIYNRSFLQKSFKEMATNCSKNNKNFSVALFDIDKFKKINDTYGHLFGDEAIKTVANITNKIATINEGMCGRFGGEEFVILLPNKSIDEALEIVSQIHALIKEEPLSHDNEEIHINVSIGVTSYPEICKEPSKLLKRADLAMYYSKQTGRGRITIDNDQIDKLIKM